MKKIFKVIISAIVIAVVALIAFVFLNKDNGNGSAYKYTQELSSNVKKDDENVALAVDDTIAQMVSLIETKNINATNELEFLKAYRQTIETYSFVYNEATLYGLFTNKVNNSAYAKNVKSSFGKLKALYLDGYNYLSETYFKLSESSYEQDGIVERYIVNFVNVFSDALKELNKFYYNVGLVLANGTENIMGFNSLDKLYTIYFAELSNNYFEKYLETGEKDGKYLTAISNTITKASKDNYDKYISNFQKYDNLLEMNKSLDVGGVVKAYVEGDYDEYLANIENETERANVEDFVLLVVEG